LNISFNPGGKQNVIGKVGQPAGDNPPATSGNADAIGDEIREIALVFLRRWRTTAAATVTATLLVMAFIWTTTPLYSSTVKILIDPRKKQAVGTEISPSGLSASNGSTDRMLVESQVEIIRSQTVAKRLIEEEGLAIDMEFSGNESGVVSHALEVFAKLVIYGPGNYQAVPMDRFEHALLTLRNRLTVKREQNTYVVAITLLSASADKAARLTNRIADIYINETNNAVSRSTRQVAENLQSRIDTLRDAARKSAATVEKYKTDNGYLGPGEKQIIQQQLQDVNNRLAGAHADAETASAQLNQLKSLNRIDDLSKTGGTPATESNVMSQLQLKLADIESEEGNIQAVYLPGHPRSARLRKRKVALHAALANENRRILDRAQRKVISAGEKVDQLTSKVAELERQVAAGNINLVPLRDLQREAEADRILYETFLSRTKAAYEQIAMPTSTARIISEAQKASRYAYPKALLMIAAAMVAGLTTGLALVWVGHVFGGGTRSAKLTSETIMTNRFSQSTQTHP
jgi:uncharacterized protein involved in exopolysaccharide biosynthesis